MNDIRYLTDHYDEKIQKILDFDAPLNFVFITDQHNGMNKHITTWDKTKKPDDYELASDAIRSIQYILDRVPNIQCVVSGGDIGNDYAPDPQKMRNSYKEVMDALYSLSVPVHCCTGNHDDGFNAASHHKVHNADVLVLPEEMHELCMKYNTTTDKNYYYADFEEQGYRFVFLDCVDKPYYKGKDGQYECYCHIGFSNTQIDWFEKVALDTNLNIIVFCHTPLRTAGIFGTENPPQGFKFFDDLTNGARAYNAIMESKNVVALIHGHVHFDNLTYDKDVLTVTTQCSYTSSWHPACPERKFRDYTETAFDVFSVKGDVVKITRFGAGEDRVGVVMRAKEIEK